MRAFLLLLVFCINTVLTVRLLRLRVNIFGNILFFSFVFFFEPEAERTRTSSSRAVESSLVDVPELDLRDIFITWSPDPRTLKKIVE